MADTSSQGTNQFPVAVTGGQIVRLALGAPAMGLIMKATIVQLNADGSAIADGNAALGGFSYPFFDAGIACPPGVTNISDEATTPLVTAAAEAQHQISPTKTVPSGKSRFLLADGTDGTFSQIGIPYINRDGSLSSAQPVIYLKLVAPGSGPKTFGVFMGIQHYRG